MSNADRDPADRDETPPLRMASRLDELEPARPSLRPTISGQYHAVAAGAYTSALRPREAPSLEPPSLPSTDRVLGRLAEVVAALGPASSSNEVVETYAALIVELLPRRLVAIRRVERDANEPALDAGDDGATSAERETVFLGAVDGIDLPIVRAGRTVAVVVIESDEPEGRDLSLDAQVARSVAPFLAAALETAERARVRANEFDTLRAQVIRADKLATLGQFAAEIVHELNNPLSAIVAYADLMARRPGCDPGDRTRLERISEAAARIQTLSRRLLAYSRPATGTMIGLYTVDDVLEQATQFCDHLASHTGTVLERTVEGDLPHLWGSPSELVQVFVNLITNACNAVEPGHGRVRITARHGATPSNVLVTIEDNGHGIPPENLPRIFDPFFTTRGTAGTGLGLSIVRYILESQGAVWRVSSTPGVGTTFEIVLTIGTPSL